MKFPKWLLVATLAVLVIFPVSALAEQITVNWWHAHGARLGELVNGIADGFNKSQNKYKVVATFKGNYAATMTAGIAAYRAKNPPHILQVFEVGTAKTCRICGGFCRFLRWGPQP